MFVLLPMIDLVVEWKFSGSFLVSLIRQIANDRHGSDRPRFLVDSRFKRSLATVNLP